MFTRKFKQDFRETAKHASYLCCWLVAITAIIFAGYKLWEDKVIAISTVIGIGLCLALGLKVLKTLFDQPAIAITASPQTEIDQLNDLIGQAKKKARQAQRAPGFNFIPVLLVYAIAGAAIFWIVSLLEGEEPGAIFSWIGFIGLFLTIILAKGLVIIRPAQFGVVTRFGMRLKGYLSEGGPYFLIPFIDAVEYLDYQVDTDPIEVSVTTGGKGKDGQKFGQVAITVKGNLRKRPSPDIVNKKGKVLFVEMSPETTTKGLRGSIASALGEIAGASLVDDFIENREALKLFINCVLRLSETPHNRCGWKPEDCPRKYAEYRNLVTELLAVERGSPSAVERQFGIEVMEFDLTEINFSKEVREAIEKRRLAENTADAAEELSKKYGELVEKAKIKAGPDWDDPRIREGILTGIEVTLGMKEKPSTTIVEAKGTDLTSAALAKYLADKSSKKGD